MFAVHNVRSLKVIDFGNAIHHIHKEVSLYYCDFELQTLQYRAPEVIYWEVFRSVNTFKTSILNLLSPFYLFLGGVLSFVSTLM